MSRHGIGLVARQELRTRLRTGRWKLLLALWFAGIGLFAVLARMGSDPEEMFGYLVFIVFTLVLLVAPALTSQAVNGDRERGTLATLQITDVTPAEIAVGKFTAAWGTALVLLGLTLPFIAWPVAEGNVSPGRAAVVVTIMAVVMGSTCAISQALSALVARGVTSSLLSYLVAFGLMVGTAVLFALAVPLTEQSHRVPGYGDNPSYMTSDTREDRIWWLLAPNPFVILSDAVPPQSDDDDTDLLEEMRSSVRDIREHDAYWESEHRREDDGGLIWPYGVGFHLMLMAGSLWLSSRRLRTPVRKLPKAVRLA